MADPSLEKGNATTGVETDHVEAVVERDDLHLKNDLAYKADDSDGKVHWNIRKCLAALSLGALHTSESLNPRKHCVRV